MDSAGSVYGPVADSCEHSNKLLFFLQRLIIP
jgi:hypothetical protein